MSANTSDSPALSARDFKAALKAKATELVAARRGELGAWTATADVLLDVKALFDGNLKPSADFFTWAEKATGGLSAGTIREYMSARLTQRDLGAPAKDVGRQALVEITKVQVADAEGEIVPAETKAERLKGLAETKGDTLKTREYVKTWRASRLSAEDKAEAEAKAAEKLAAARKAAREDLHKALVGTVRDTLVAINAKGNHDPVEAQEMYLQGLKDMAGREGDRTIILQVINGIHRAYQTVQAERSERNIGDEGVGAPDSDEGPTDEDLAAIENAS